MGAEQSAEQQDSSSLGKPQATDDGPVMMSHGWRILSVVPDGPAAGQDLVVFFDFIVAANGQPLSNDEQSFFEVITSSVDTPLTLTVYNYRLDYVRDIVMTPTRNWAGNGLLGLVVINEAFTSVDEHIIHVLDIFEKSPAAAAHLVPHRDYLLGTSHTQFRSLDSLSHVLDQAVVNNTSLECFVYNESTHAIRTVSIRPDENWGGDGSLGCDVGFGYLHQLPPAPAHQLAAVPQQFRSAQVLAPTQQDEQDEKSAPVAAVSSPVSVVSEQQQSPPTVDPTALATPLPADSPVHSEASATSFVQEVAPPQPQPSPQNQPSGDVPDLSGLTVSAPAQSQSDLVEVALP